MATPVVVFSAMVREAVSTENSGGSFTSATVMVTSMVAVPPLLSSALTVTE